MILNNMAFMKLKKLLKLWGRRGPAKERGNYLSRQIAKINDLLEIIELQLNETNTDDDRTMLINSFNRMIDETVKTRNLIAALPEFGHGRSGAEKCDIVLQK